MGAGPAGVHQGVTVKSEKTCSWIRKSLLFKSQDSLDFDFLSFLNF